ncbi:ABC transporter ATP-binding protein [Desulfurococcus mucosus]|uniref:ABC transporter related protein n=1 Tax=Desulfurococcus mucosus (strain ATCC 35584 / DSM 2162 / JCM 9187 / O7/1) TaxID=765177 RepID=E8R6X8_DESM0|nr:ABC transporter ATP-binding protein [Desulfurococcus mucosus]ADV64411.1 ABC transporter related protein [Desulfurococcus mucosus DSM 2162]
MVNAVEIRSFTKKFGDFTAVEDLNLDIREGEVFGLLGPNGSGKTTTLLTVATIYRPTSGDIYVYGHSVVREDYIVRKMIGIAFQDPKALWVDKPYDLLIWHAKVVGYSGEEARRVVREVMEALGLWEHRNKYFYQLSGGTRKKVELAKVLVQKPRLAILDEPTAQVDVLAKHALWDVIKRLKREGVTVILATNDMFEAERVCERVAIIHKGRLRALGTIDELKDLIPGGDVVEIQVGGTGIPVSIMEKLGEYGRVEAGNGSLRIYLEKGEEKVVDIVDLLRRNNIAVSRLMIKEPTLDDVFTYLTGARLRGE